ncbi:MAG: rhodanese-like domain-containing protein [Alphaproteobacteria bacterium]
MAMPPGGHPPRFERLCEEARTRIREIDATEASRLARETGSVLVDVREESEWAAGHAKGAIHLSKGVIERDVEARIPDLDAQILCYCGGGYRSALVVDALQRMGYRNAWSVAGGWRAWTASGLPVVSG